MNSLSIKDVASYDFNLLGSEVELVVHHASNSKIRSTVIRLLPPVATNASEKAPEPVAATVTPAIQVPATTTPKPAKKRNSSSRLRRRKGALSGRPYIQHEERLRTNGVPVMSKLKEEEVKLIRELWPLALEECTSKRQAEFRLAEMFEVSAANIHQIVNGLTWKHLL